MSCRKICFSKNKKYVIKYIQNFDNSVFSSIDEIYSDNFIECLNIDKITKQAVVQQINEIKLYSIVTEEERKILAPQLGLINNNKHHIPSIIFPYFTPLFTDEEVWNYNEEDLLKLIGFRAAAHKVTEQNLLIFFNQVKKLCEEYDLLEDDILFNPSNIGYNSTFGLRVLDYGLANDGSLLEI